MDKTTRTTEGFRLLKDETIRLPRGIALIIRVEGGTMLVTQEGDLDDHVLEEGGEVAVPAGGLAVAWAFTEARGSVGSAHRRQRAA